MFTKTLLIYFIVFLLSDYAYGQRDKKFFRTDYNYIETTQGFYKIHTLQQTWADAKRVCALEGASLFYAENRDEANAVISWWKTVQPNVKFAFVGISDIITESVFETIDGRLVSEVYNQWQRGEPNDLNGDEDCVHLKLSGDLNDYRCDGESYFICKKSLASLEWDSHCNMPKSGYTFSEDLSKCYKLHTTPLNWMDAHTVCRTEQTYLAMVSNQLEAEYLANVTESASSRRIEGDYVKGIFHAGFHNTLNKGWQTVRGTPIPSDASLWWDNDVPTEDEHKQCGSMFYTGSLNIVNCATRSLFICEREIDAVRLDARNNLSNMKLTN
uniref:IML24 n=1 Tax=Mythimna separata TaxID=271217 RepID=A0A8F3C7H3_MYTSE|nr:IML24 [Mythimna separata]